jgi:hypothetical protein
MASKKHDRQISGYLSPLNFRFVTLYQGYAGKSRSRIVNDAVTSLFESLPKDEKERILKSNNDARRNEDSAE